MCAKQLFLHTIMLCARKWPTYSPVDDWSLLFLGLFQIWYITINIAIMVNVANGPEVTYPDPLLAKKINAFKKLNPRKANRVNKIFLVVFILLICF